MPRYKVTDNQTGKQYILTGDSPPTEQELQEIFGDVRKSQTPGMSVMHGRNEVEQKKGFVGRVGEDVSKRLKNIGNEPLTVQSVATLRQPLHVAGHLAGLGNDIIREGLVSAYHLLPDRAERAISKGFGYLAGTRPGQTALGAISDVQEAYGQFKKAHPEVAGDIEAGANILGLGYASKGLYPGVKLAGQEGKAVARDMTKLALRKSPQKMQKVLNKVIDRHIQAIRPSVAGKKTFGQLRAYNEKARGAVKAIVRNKSNLKYTDDLGQEIQGKLPKNLAQFSQAVDQTKKQIFQQYDDLARQAGTKGAEVDLKPVADMLDDIARNESLVAPEMNVFAGKLRDSMLARGKLSVLEAQDEIMKLNDKLSAFYKNPSPALVDRASVYHKVAESLRKSLDDAIENAEGTGYQALKNEYGALKTIERDVTRRAIVDARKNLKGLSEELADVSVGGAFTAGLLYQNPKLLAASMGIKGVSKYTKWINNPNRRIAKMFRSVDRLMQAENSRFIPESEAFKALMNNRGQLSLVQARRLDSIGTKKAAGKPLTDEDRKFLFDVLDESQVYKNVKKSVTREKGLQNMSRWEE